MQEHTGKYRVRNKATGLYLVAPIDGCGRQEPQWERIPEAAFRFSKSEAQDQVNYLGWHPHRIPAEVTTSTKMKA